MHLKIEFELNKQTQNLPSNTIATALGVLLLRSMGRFSDTPNDMLGRNLNAAQILHEAGVGPDLGKELEEVHFRITLYPESMDQRQLLPQDEITATQAFPFPKKSVLEA